MPAAGITIAVPLGTAEERRGAERFVAAMPVHVEGHLGRTQDLSISGLSFIADRPYPPGARVEVVVEYLLDGHNYPLRCEVEVVRAERCAEGFLIGARLAPQPQLQEVPVGKARSPRLRSID